MFRPLSSRLLCVAALLGSTALLAQSERHGRKYKAPPETSHVEILVLRDSNGKVIENAGVVFHPYKGTVDEGNLEVKTGPDGKAFIDIIPTGSTVQVQVIATGFSTYSSTFDLNEPSKQVTIRMLRPRRQISAYTDNPGGESARKVGVQEAEHRTATPTVPKPLSVTDPVIKLSTSPADPKQKGDPTQASDQSDASAKKSAKQGKNSTSDAPAADTAGSSTPN